MKNIAGILKQRKYVVTDYLEHTRVKGTEKDFIIIEDHHERNYK